VADDGNGTAALVATANSPAPFALTVTGATVTASIASASVTEGDPVAFSATTSLPNPTWTVSGNPAWMTFAATGGTYATSAISADVPATVTYPVVLKATSGTATAQQTVNVTVSASTATVSDAAVRSAAAFSMAVTESMPAAGTWSASASAADVTGLTVSGGTLTGRAPANAGAVLTRSVTATFTAGAGPGVGSAAAASASGTLTVHPSLSIASQSARSGTVGSPVTFGAPSVGGQVGTLAYTLLSGTTDVSATLSAICPGLSFAKATGAVSGTPTGTCSPSLTYRVADNGGGNALLAATADSPSPFALTVTDASVTASASSLGVVEGEAVILSATTSLPGPTWTVSGNPAWMTFAATGGTFVTGSVSGDVAATTTYPVVLKATSGTATAQRTVNVTVTPAVATLATPPAVRSGAPFSAAVSDTMTATGTWTASAAPADVTGLAISGGTLSGTAPANAGTTAIARTLTATHTGPSVSSGTRATASATATLTVYPVLSIAAPANRSGVSGNAMSFAAPAVTGAAGTVGYDLFSGTTNVSNTLPALCPGLAFSQTNGTISGTPTSACAPSLTYKAADSALAATVQSAAFTLTVVPDRPALYFTAGGAASGNGHTFDLGTTTNGMGGTTQSISVTNNGTKATTSLAITASEGNGGPSFSIAGMGTCASPVPVNGTCSFTLKAAGNTNAVHTGTVTVRDASGVQVSAALRVTTQGVVAAGNQMFFGMKQNSEWTSSFVLPSGRTSLKVRVLLVGAGYPGQSVQGIGCGQFDGGGSGWIGLYDTEFFSSVRIYFGAVLPTLKTGCQTLRSRDTFINFKGSVGALGDTNLYGFAAHGTGGGSGGGTCGYAGGTAGSNGGGTGTATCPGGTGNSKNIDFSRLKQRTFAYGAGGAPGPNTDPGWLSPGGGGGGGVIIDGDPESGSADENMTKYYAPNNSRQGYPGQGYGAGGFGGSGRTFGGTSEDAYPGGSGSPGFVYIEWDAQ
jgi:hypothetical protein